MIYLCEFEEPHKLVDTGAAPDVPHTESGDADGEAQEIPPGLPLSPVAR